MNLVFHPFELFGLALAVFAVGMSAGLGADVEGSVPVVCGSWPGGLSTRTMRGSGLGDDC